MKQHHTRFNTATSPLHSLLNGLLKYATILVMAVMMMPLWGFAQEPQGISSDKVDDEMEVVVDDPGQLRATTVKMGPDGSQHIFPFNNYYHYSWNQMIYTAEELGGAQTISSISFLLAAVPSTAYTATSLTVYMGHTSLGGTTGDTDLTTTNWVPSSSLTQVFTASNYQPTTLTTWSDYGGGNGWVTIYLDNSFSYNGTDNLAIVISDSNSSYTNGLTFKYITDAHNLCIYRRSDNTSNYASHPGTNSGTVSKNRPVLKLCAYDEYGNVVNLKKTTVTAGNDITFVDEGGDGGDCSTTDQSNNYYTVYADYRHVFTTTGGTLRVTFSELCTESSYDYLYVYDGYNNYSNGLSGGLNGSYSSMPGPYNSSGQSMTFKFHEDSSNNYKGWKATITHVPFPTLTFSASPSGSGSVSVSDNGNTVSSGSTIPGGTILDISASANSGYVFTSWTVSGTGASVYDSSDPSTTLTMGSANTSLTANFVAIPANSYCSTATSLPCGTTNMSGTTVNTPGEPHGIPNHDISNYGVWYTFTGDGSRTTVSVTSSVDMEMVACTGSCNSLSFYKYYDDPPELTFDTENGTTYYIYVAYYSSSGTSSNTGAFTISRTCIPRYTITLAQNPSNCGTVSVYNNGNAVSSGSYVFQGDVLDISVTPNTGYIFTSWSVSGSGSSVASSTSSTTTLTIGSANVTLTANFLAVTEVEIGSSTSTNSSLPTNVHWDYSLTQQIYYPEEIGHTGTIRSISFYYSSSTSITRNIDIYLSMGGPSYYPSSNAAFVPQNTSNATKVFSGSYTFHQGWNTIVFSSTFNYSDIKNNLMITVDDNTGSYVSSYSFATYNTSKNCSLYVYQDGTDYDPWNPPTPNSTTYKNYIKLGFTTNTVTNCYTITATPNPAADGFLTENIIGTGTSSATSVPFLSAWGYSFEEQIYPANAMGGAGTINSISFYLNSSYTSAQANHIVLYMKNVLRGSFISDTDFETVTANDIVFDGTWTIPANTTGWITITLDTPFAYDGTSNLMVAMHENTGGYNSRSFRDESIGVNVRINCYHDSYDPDPYNPASFSGNKGRGTNRAQMKLDIDYSDDFSRMYPNGASCTLTAEPNPPTSNSTYIFTNWTENNSEVSTNNPYTFTVSADHDLVANFFECVPPTNLAVTANSNTTTGATVSWSGTSSSYIVEYQIPALYENFDNNGTSLPSGWTSQATVGSGSWAISNSEGSHSSPYSARCAHSNRLDETYLITPTMNLSGASSATLTFWMKNRNWGTADIEECHVYYRVNGGSWTELWSTTIEHLWEKITVPLTGLAANYQLGFKCVDHYGYGLCIDDVLVTTNNWTTASSSATSPYTISALQSNTFYVARVRNLCDEVSNVVNFTTLASVTTTNITTYASTSATMGGSWANGGGASTSAHGVVYSSSNSTPTLGGSGCTTASISNGNYSGFSQNVTGLTSNTLYYVRAYVTNAGGTSYGTVKIFTTLAEVSTPTSSNITSSSATFSSSVTTGGNASITQRGVYWSTSSTAPNSSTTLNSSNSMAASTAATGSYNVTPTSFSTGTTYYVWAYVRNAGGINFSPSYASITTLTRHTVTYDKNHSGATGTMTDTNSPYDYNSSVTVLANSFTAPSNYIFGIWNTAANGSGTSYAAGSTFTITANTTLYAQWAPIHISNATQWNEFSTVVNEGFSYSGQTVYLDADITVTTSAPVGTSSKPFQGTFEGNGHVVNYTNTANVTDKGLFGYVSGSGNIQNLIVNATLSGTSTSVGAVVGTFASSGTISNVEGAGTISSSSTNAGGIVGRMTNGTLHSSFAAATFSGSATNKGGLVGNNSGNLYNCYSNCTFSGSATYKGGLAGVNNSGKYIENCYAAGIASGVSAFAGSNSGTIQYCYANAVGNGYVGSSSTAPSGCGLYGAVQSDIKHLDYMYRDNLITKNTNTYVGSNDAITDGINVYVSNHIPVWNGLVSALNQWVRSNPEGLSGLASWYRPMTTNINGDLPVLAFPKDNALATTNVKYLQYNPSLDRLLSDHASNTAYIFHYGTATGVTQTPGVNVHVFVQEDAVLLQATSPDPGAFNNTTVGVTFDNSDHGTHAQDFWGNTLSYDWHLLSTPLNSPLTGATHGSYSASGDPNSAVDITGIGGYFPNSLITQSNPAIGGSIMWDFYSYYEPQYHWINLKRNRNNHYHYDGGAPIVYNEADQDAGNGSAYYIPGKGYMMAISQNTFMNATGTLNRGNVSITLTNQEPADIQYAKGWNLVGNPYQAYLDLNSIGRSPIYTYDADQGLYLPFAATASENPAIVSQYIHPHQAFFVHTDTNGETMTFTQSMATTTSNGSSYYREDAINYPLVNLFAENSLGQRDLTVVEFHRPEIGGALKYVSMNTAPFSLAAHHNGTSYGILFSTDDMERIPVHFKTDEDDDITLTWSYYNGIFSQLYLVDNLLGVTYDMLTHDSYFFHARFTDYASRFYITYECTGVDEYDDSGGSGGGHFAYISNDNIVIEVEAQNGATLQLVDVLGRVLYSTVCPEGMHTVSTSGLAKGVYIIRLATNNSVRTQKVIVK